MDDKCRCIYNKLISLFAQTGEKLTFFRENDIENLFDLYSIYKKMEYALYDFGSLLFDLECNKRDTSKEQTEVSVSLCRHYLSSREAARVQTYSVIKRLCGAKP